MNTEKVIISPLADAPLTPMRCEPVILPFYPRHHEGARHVAGLLDGADAEGYSLVNFGDLVDKVSAWTGTDRSLLKGEQWMVADALGRLGIRMAPDPLLERRRLRNRDNAVLYRSEEKAPTVRLRSYKKALLFAKLATLALGALSASELEEAGRVMDGYVKQPHYRRHLRALARWYGARRRLLDVRTRRTMAEILAPPEGRAMASALLRLAAARGEALTPAAVSQLERLMPLLGVVEADVHSLLHRARCAEELPQTPDGDGCAALIDAGRLPAVEEQTRAAREMLGDLFDPEPEPPAPAPDTEAAVAPALRLLSRLFEREVWPLAEAEEVARGMGLDLTVALEEINDMAAELAGDTVADIEGETLAMVPDYRHLFT